MRSLFVGSSMLRVLTLCAAAYALDRPTSRFQNVFSNRGSAVTRKRTLPVYRPPDSPANPLPVPGTSRSLRYQPEGAANAQLVKDLKQYGAMVVVIGDGEDEPIGCVVDVRLAEASDDGTCAIIAQCASSNARVSLGRVAKSFPYTAREVAPLSDTDALDADDVLAAYDVIEEDSIATVNARKGCIEVLTTTLDLCASLRPSLGAIDAFGTEIKEGEYMRMTARLLEAVEAQDEEDGEERDRRLSFLCLSLVDAPDELRRRCLATRSAARRYAAVARFLKPLQRELSAACMLGVATAAPAAPCPVDAPLAFAALRQGRRLAYWWSDALGWCAGEASYAEDGAVDIVFDAAPGESSSATQRLELLGADRARWKLLPL